MQAGMNAGIDVLNRRPSGGEWLGMGIPRKDANNARVISSSALLKKGVDL